MDGALHTWASWRLGEGHLEGKSLLPGGLTFGIPSGSSDSGLIGGESGKKMDKLGLGAVFE